MTATKKISLTINARVCAGERGQTILEIARANDINIPTLCYLKGPDRVGRLPVVHR